MKRNHPSTGALAIVAALAIGATGLNWIYHSVVVDKLERIEEKGEDRVLTTKWISDGKERSWTSTFKEHTGTETKPQFFARHRAELAEAMAEFPEDTAGGSGPSGGGF